MPNLLKRFGAAIWRPLTRARRASVLQIVRAASASGQFVKGFAQKNYEQLKNIASAVQSLTAALAIAVGGGWALHLHVRLKEAEIARLQAEDLANRWPVVDLEVSARELMVPGECRRRLHVSAVISNNGSRPTKVRLVGPGVAIHDASAEGDPENSKALLYLPNKGLASGYVLRPNGGKYHADFTPFRVPKPGIYYVVLRLTVPDDEGARVREVFKLPENTILAWMRGVYVPIGSDSGQCEPHASEVED